MKKIIVGLFIILYGLGCTRITYSVPEFKNAEQEQVFEVIRRVYSWQLNNMDSSPPKSWQTATFYIGAMSAYRQTGYGKFLMDAHSWAQSNDWQVGSRLLNADDQASAQVYLDLYREFGEQFMISNYKTVADKMTGERLHNDNGVLWWWADALFMAPPALAKLLALTNDSRYLTVLDESWRESYNILYSEGDSLFFRDRRHNNDYDSEGNKMFWLRGNGWVVAGLTRMLKELLDKEIKIDEEYKTVYIQLVEKLLSLQQDDGLWRSNLYYPDRYPRPETSGSALICYALAWGINNDLLNDSRYERAMLISWNSLTNKINERGKLGYVQPVGYRPGKAEPHNAEIFGSGVLILAGSEVFNYYN